MSNIYKDVLNFYDSCGHTPFFIAILKGYKQMAELLLEDEMSDVNYPDEMEDTPLHWAVILDRPDIVEFLL